ncbi:hypothetical protein F9C07_2286489 [Aspergillus flavus]|uniref:Bulb-type lectin domain-containing protein n=1 Tax=Aspergillus flavus (strain ATCC 200026 / FGSC A1120 / IAM 13836 / NRRL 3357 / JCM 12722 / SRRC 167) TaxID=332952 RepID=A0A7U2N2L4_ASPFN|nr:hypothetical protein F9C07_2286489 [Aspergillus flavus]
MPLAVWQTRREQINTVMPSFQMLNSTIQSLRNTCLSSSSIRSKSPLHLHISSDNMPNILQNGQWLRPGQNIKSEDGRSGLTMQEDGKIDVYHDGRCVWQNTREQRYDIQGIHMQEDGDLVM